MVFDKQTRVFLAPPAGLEWSGERREITGLYAKSSPMTLIQYSLPTLVHSYSSLEGVNENEWVNSTLSTPEGLPLIVCLIFEMGSSSSKIEGLILNSEIIPNSHSPSKKLGKIHKTHFQHNITTSGSFWLWQWNDQKHVVLFSFLYILWYCNGGWEHHYKYTVLLPKLFLRWYLFILKIQIFVNHYNLLSILIILACTPCG